MAAAFLSRHSPHVAWCRASFPVYPSVWDSAMIGTVRQRQFGMMSVYAPVATMNHSTMPCAGRAWVLPLPSHDDSLSDGSDRSDDG